MVPDPYLALQLPHSATPEEIKRSYRELARRYHPDRLMSRIDPAVSDLERDRTTHKFADLAAAYAILSDPQRKAEYDYIYKYGGYDHQDEQQHDIIKATATTTGTSKSPPCANDQQQPQPQAQPQTSSSSNSTPPNTNSSNNNNNNSDPSHPSRKRRKSATGIGYTCVDPLSFLWTQGKVQQTRAVAGIQIPSRLQMMHAAAASTGGNNNNNNNNSSAGGLRFAFSAGYAYTQQGGTRKFISRTTQFAQGKKWTRTETTILHSDGRREVVIEGNDDVIERRLFTTTTAPQWNGRHHVEENVAAQSSQEEPTLPWYMNAWHVMKDKMTQCYNPCTVVAH